MKRDLEPAGIRPREDQPIHRARLLGIPNSNRGRRRSVPITDGSRGSAYLREPWEQGTSAVGGGTHQGIRAVARSGRRSDATIWFVAGLITVADWIGSDERHFPQDARWDMTERRKRAQSALASDPLANGRHTGTERIR